jgi:hypothetical protein
MTKGRNSKLPAPNQFANVGAILIAETTEMLRPNGPNVELVKEFACSTKVFCLSSATGRLASRMNRRDPPSGVAQGGA